MQIADFLIVYENIDCQDIPTLLAHYKNISIETSLLSHYGTSRPKTFHSTLTLWLHPHAALILYYGSIPPRTSLLYSHTMEISLIMNISTRLSYYKNIPKTSRSPLTL